MDGHGILDVVAAAGASPVTLDQSPPSGAVPLGGTMSLEASGASSSWNPVNWDGSAWNGSAWNGQN